MNQELLKINFCNQIGQAIWQAENLCQSWDKKSCPKALLCEKTYELFLKALDFITVDNGWKIHPQFFSNFWVGRFCRFQQLSRKLLALASKANSIGKQVDSEDLMGQVYAQVKSKAQELQDKLWTAGRLPIQYGSYLETRKQHFSEELTLANVSQRTLFAGDSETFHLLASHFPDLKGVNGEQLEGRGTSKSILTLIRLVEQTFMKTHKGQGNKQALLRGLKGALNIALKLDFATVCLKKGEDSSPYLERVANIEPLLARLEQQKKEGKRGWNIEEDPLFSSVLGSREANTLQLFLSKTQEKGFHYPLELGLHNITWDILEAIQGLGDKEFILVPLGSANHLVIAKVECQILDGKRRYQYILFNTGEGCIEHHMTEEVNCQTFVKPLRIEQIKSKG